MSDAFEQCELTHMTREPIDLSLARAQHAAYERALESLGCTLVRAAGAPTLADSVFVEDIAVVVDEVAILTRPGALSRRPETEGVAEALGAHREVVPMVGPGTVDGGDVLRLGRRLYVGSSSRSNEAGIAELRELLSPHGYEVVAVQMGACLHLKTAVTSAAEDLLLIQPEWVDARRFGDRRVVEVDPTEPFGANGLCVGGRFLYSSAYPKTRARLEAAGVAVLTVDQSELAKAEGAITCCSVVFSG